MILNVIWIKMNNFNCVSDVSDSFKNHFKTFINMILDQLERSCQCGAHA